MTCRYVLKNKLLLRINLVYLNRIQPLLTNCGVFLCLLFLLFVVFFVCLFSFIVCVGGKQQKFVNESWLASVECDQDQVAPLGGGGSLHTLTRKLKERQAPYSMNLIIINTI